MYQFLWLKNWVKYCLYPEQKPEPKFFQTGTAINHYGSTTLLHFTGVSCNNPIMVGWANKWAWLALAVNPPPAANQGLILVTTWPRRVYRWHGWAWPALAALPLLHPPLAASQELILVVTWPRKVYRWRGWAWPALAALPLLHPPLAASQELILVATWPRKVYRWRGWAWPALAALPLLHLPLAAAPRLQTWVKKRLRLSNKKNMYTVSAKANKSLRVTL